MFRALLVTICFHDGRCHGMDDGPPSPARLFQALIAGAGLGGPQSLEEFEPALEWLQALNPPLIAAPALAGGQRLKVYVPTNDLDAVAGDPRRIGKIRTAKTIRPLVFDAAIPFLYAWGFPQNAESERHADTLCALAERLYQFGRGVDMAWAWGEVLDDDELEARLSGYPGLIHHPSPGSGGRTLACPEPGSLATLIARHRAGSQRFKTEGQGKVTGQLFSQPPKARFAQVTYNSPPSQRVYELRDPSSDASFSVWPLAKASKLVVCLRNAAAERLQRALPELKSDIERILVGRKADGADAGPTSARLRIVPLPSIGHPRADHGIRRVLVEVPAGCPLRADDVHWAFSGLEPVDQETGEVLNFILTPAGDDAMLPRYGVAEGTRFRVWRTVTPAVLPEATERRRIDPARTTAEAKNGSERAAEQARAASAVPQALRHAEVRNRADTIAVQREPFESRGERVEAFAPGTRFAKERLWHVRITFAAPAPGPIVIGDGRFLGLGVMAPVQRVEGIHAFVVESGLAATPQLSDMTHALRRAVMARVQEKLGPRATLPAFFTGHEPDGSPARAERHPHVAFVFDPKLVRLLIVAPHILDRRAPTREEVEHLAKLDAALIDFCELRAGSAGRLVLRRNAVETDSDPLFAASRTWESVIPYQATRHTKHVGAAEALASDVRAECRRRGLPEPHVTPFDAHGIAGLALVGGARLTFEVAIEGPVLLGRSRYVGGGLFEGTA